MNYPVDQAELREYANDLSNDAMRSVKERITIPSGELCVKCSMPTELKMIGDDISEKCTSCSYKENL